MPAINIKENEKYFFKFSPNFFLLDRFYIQYYFYVFKQFGVFLDSVLEFF